MSATELSLKDRQRQMREAAILEAAHRLLAEKGYQGMTMDDLATRVGIAKGSLYQHFKSKEELIGVALVSFMDRISNYIDTLPATQPAIERIKLTCRKALVLRFQDGFPDILGVKSIVKESLTCHPAYIASTGRLMVALAGLFDIAKKQGDVSSDIPTELLMLRARMYTYSEQWGPVIHFANVRYPIVWGPFVWLSIALTTLILLPDDRGRSRVMSGVSAVIARKRGLPARPSVGRELLVGVVILGLGYALCMGIYGTLRVTGASQPTKGAAWPYPQVKLYDPYGHQRAVGNPGPYFR